MNNPCVQPVGTLPPPSLKLDRCQKHSVACNSIANRHGIPLMLIADRQQAQDDLVGGYGAFS